MTTQNHLTISQKKYNTGKQLLGKTNDGKYSFSKLYIKLLKIKK